MIAIKLTKVYYVNHDVSEHFQTEEDKRRSKKDDFPQFTQGWVEHICEDQTFDNLAYMEAINIEVEKIPFIKFRILKSTDGGFKLESYSPVSLQTYQTNADHPHEKWGTFLDIGQCVNKALSITAGFVNKMGKEYVNDGHYYKE